jgi:hypothetical protein
LKKEKDQAEKEKEKREVKKEEVQPFKRKTTAIIAESSEKKV